MASLSADCCCACVCEGSPKKDYCEQTVVSLAPGATTACSALCIATTLAVVASCHDNLRGEMISHF